LGVSFFVLRWAAGKKASKKFLQGTWTKTISPLPSLAH
jgi:hypothetical protein